MATRMQRMAPSWLTTVLQQRALIIAIVAAIFVMGAIVGGFAAGTLDAGSAQELSGFLRSSLTRLGAEGAGNTGWQRVIMDEVIKPAGLVWLLGLSVIGVPLIAAVVFLRGFLLGFTLAFLVKTLVLRGMVFVVVALVPANTLLMPGLLLAAVGAIGFALGALQIVLGRPGARDIFHHLRVEGSVSLLGCILLLAGGVLKVYLAPAITAVAARLLL